MVEWVRKAIAILPAHMAAVIKFNCLTGLRPSEAIESVRLLTSVRIRTYLSSSKEIFGYNQRSACHGVQQSTSKDIGRYTVRYYNPERQCLEHFRFPDLFIRRTKTAYISYLSLDNYHYFSNLGTRIPTYPTLRFRLERAGVQCHLAYCRKIFASDLRQKGIIEPEIVDLLQGRVSQSILTRHYLSPDATLRQRVLKAVEELQKHLNL